MTKVMWNLFMPDMIKLFHAEIVWFGGTGADNVTLDVQSEGSIVQITQSGVINGTGDPNWHLTYIDGTIIPQPNVETFTFNFAPVGGSAIYVDAAYIGTHCIPEPASMLALLCGLGGLVWRRKR